MCKSTFFQTLGKNMEIFANNHEFAVCKITYTTWTTKGIPIGTPFLLFFVLQMLIFKAFGLLIPS